MKNVSYLPNRTVPSRRRQPLSSLLRRGLSLIALVSLGGVLGCGPGNLRATDLTPKERDVQLFENGEAPNCTLFEDYGTISVESGTSLSQGTYESSKAKLKRAAAELGATSVRVTSQNTAGKIHKASGVAIKCLKREG
ncbi:MAG TPA: hypothetical protein PKL17_19595 [Pseudomonadota bacterium]|jgi:hypothetical protein|nr:hypothetical protein [Pseudomonadota bacterium]HNI59774.1 hypothetical protein [Pseudomonadota bacterium]HNK46998.1 hypothetical protein [Pseudomonadota bacterium]HNN50935.1 hypothetical protein [Pseudomonadota bacterium]